MIPFNKPFIAKNSWSENLFQEGESYKVECQSWFQKTYDVHGFLTTSCTHGLELISLVSNIQRGDEVIMASYTFPSSANAFILRGAVVKFVDIRLDTLNIDENKIEAAITSKTKAIVVMHYAGVGCEMETILSIAKKYNLLVFEDAAQCIDAKYWGKLLGTFGDFGAISFHSTKNLHCGEGGILFVNNESYLQKTYIAYEKGTNRRQFLEGRVEKYTWVDLGSSFALSDINAAYLLPQLIASTKITNKRKLLWNRYFENLKALEAKGLINLPNIPEYCNHNAHIFYIKCKNDIERSKLSSFLAKNQIQAYFHYLPLHSSPAGKKFGVFVGEDVFTTIQSKRLLRLPMFFDLTLDEVDIVCERIEKFYSTNGTL